MTLIQLEYIVAVDNYRHFAKAAEHCFVTQPTLSMQIQKLEDQLGVTIFDRKHQPVIPTPIGEQIIKQARFVLEASKKIQDLIEMEKEEVTGSLKIGIIPTLAPYLLPLFVTKFLTDHPKVNLTVEEVVTESIVEKLKKGLIDVGLIVTPSEEEELKEYPIFQEEFIAYIGLRHPLFKKDNLNLSDITTKGLWLLSEGHCFRNQVLNICNAPSKPIQNDQVFSYESGSLEALKKIVDKHGGVTLLPQLATQDFDNASKQKLRIFNEPKPVREVSLVTHQNFVRNKIVEALFNSIASSIPPFINTSKNGNVIKWK